jgi:hypothetical protein
MNGMFLCTAKQFNKIDESTGEVKVDKNGLPSVLLNVLAGKAPNRNIISGTIADREGFEIGKSYLVSFNEREADEEHGRQFNFTKVGEASIMDVLQAKAQLGDAVIVSVDGTSTDGEGTPETKEEEIEIEEEN